MDNMNGFTLVTDPESSMHCSQASFGTNSSSCLLYTRSKVVADTRLLIHVYVVPRIMDRAAPLYPHMSLWHYAGLRRGTALVTICHRA